MKKFFYPKKITFSIIITILNRKKQLLKLLYSLTCQSYKDFEILIIDDGSSEDLLFIINNFYLKLKIRYYKKKIQVLDYLEILEQA